MRPMLKYPVIFGIILVLLLLNAIPVLLFWDRTALANHSLLPIMFMGLNLLHGLTACLRKHKGNYLVFRKAGRLPLSGNRDYTYTETYERKFRWMLAVYFGAIPFYIPVIFFAPDIPQALWMLPVLFVPQMVFMTHGIYETVQDAKEAKRMRERQEREKQEQEAREEMGRWK